MYVRNICYIRYNYFLETISSACVCKTKSILARNVDKHFPCSCHMRMVDTPPGSADEFEVILDDDERLVVRRHARWVQRSATHVQSDSH